MKNLLVYLKNYKLESILAPLFKMLEASFELVVPLVVASIIDNGIKNNDVKFIISRVCILIGLAIIGMVASITAQYFAAKAATGFATELRASLYKKIQSFSFSELDNIGTSTLINRITNDVNQTQSGVNMVLRLFLRSPFIVIGAFVMSLIIDVKASLIFLLVIILLSVVIFTIMKVTVPKYSKVQKSLDSLTLSTRENLSGVRVIRAFTEEEQENIKFSKKNNLLATMQKAVGKISSLTNPITYVIINLGIVGLIYFGSVQVNNGALSQGNVVALYNYMSQILVELIKFANLIVIVTKAYACGDRINQVMNTQNTQEFNNNNQQINDSVVTFNDVSLVYKGSKENSLSNISFSANKGQTIGIIGSTGSGKSSLVNLIPHYYDSTKGTVTVFGKDVKSYNNDDLRSKIGFVLQKAVLFNGTVRQNIQWGKKDATDEEIINSLKLAQVYDTVMEKGGLDAKISQNGSNLSGGQKQRLSIARALVSKPQIIVLDDSSSALDYATEKSLLSSIFNLDYHPTIFIVSQRCSSILSADKIIVLDDGNCVGIGTHSQLVESCEVYQQIYKSQFNMEDNHE